MSCPAVRLIAPAASWIALAPSSVMLPVFSLTLLFTKSYPACMVSDQLWESVMMAPSFRKIFPPACNVTRPLLLPVLPLKSQTAPASIVILPVACSLMLEKFLFANEPPVPTFRFNVPRVL